jgi:hypothetical protein
METVEEVGAAAVMTAAVLQTNVSQFVGESCDLAKVALLGWFSSSCLAGELVAVFEWEGVLSEFSQ